MKGQFIVSDQAGRFNGGYQDIMAPVMVLILLVSPDSLSVNKFNNVYVTETSLGTGTNLDIVTI